MNLKLHSDYVDFYDSLFDARPSYDKRHDPELEKYFYEPFYNLKDGDTFLRIANINSTPTRLWCFQEMKRLGEKVIPYGTVRELADWLPDLKAVVVYTDDRRHAGYGKYYMPIQEALAEFPETLASAFVKTDEKVAKSHKYLQIGMNAFIIQMTSFNDWRTNAGHIECEVLKFWRLEPTPRVMHRCLWAIDYVTDIETGETYAIDYNMAPGCRSIGVTEYLTATQAVQGIKDWYEIKHEKERLPWN